MIAITHIQKTAPGPPIPIASATPVTFPVPTRDAALIVKAWNGETPSLLSFFSTIRRNISLNKRTCTNLVRTVKYTPKTSNTAINIYVHKKLFNGQTSQFKNPSPSHSILSTLCFIDLFILLIYTLNYNHSVKVYVF